MRDRRMVWLVGLSVCAAMGCSDSLSPADYVGEYVLTQIDGDPLPALLFKSDLVVATAIADTIRLRADGTGSRKRTILYDGFGASLAVRAPNFSVSESDLQYDVLGGVLEISYVCPPNASCAPPPHALAVRTSAGLNITREGNNRAPQEFVSLGAR